MCNKYYEYFYGNKVSNEGLKYGFVDYGTFAKSFDAVMCNNLITATTNAGMYWDMVSGFVDNSEKIEKLENELETLKENEENADKITNLEDQIYDLQCEQDNPGEVFQWFVIDNLGVALCKEAGEIVYYCEDIDTYIWGVTHLGTHWDYVLTNIPLKVMEG